MCPLCSLWLFLILNVRVIAQSLGVLLRHGLEKLMRHHADEKRCGLSQPDPQRVVVHHFYLVQCKARKVGKRADPLNLMSPAEREALTAEAVKWNAVALLAYKRDGVIQYKQV